MKVLVLGAGIAGVTAAYTLASRGHEVEVIDQEHGPAEQCSYANGAQLSYTHAEPWANPGAIPKMLKWMFRDDAPLVFRLRPEIHMMKWGLKFLSNCTTSRAHQNCETMLRLGMHSKTKLHQIADDTGITFDHSYGGILHVFTDEKEMAAAAAQAEFQETLGLGCKEHILDSKTKVFENEPSLRDAEKDIIGGIFSDYDESGNIYMFTKNLAEYCEKELGVVFHYDTDIAWMRQDKGEISRVETSRGHFTADKYVMALGSYSAVHLRRVGINLPIYPMKGYSITVPAWDDAPQKSVTDAEQKIVVSRIGDLVRAAGTAEIAGYNHVIREKRITPLVNCLHTLFPHATIDQVEKWACLRPQTPDGPPIVGATPLSNLYLNTGHGTLGWTQGPATAYMLADIMEGRETEISLAGLDMSRY